MQGDQQQLGAAWGMHPCGAAADTGWHETKQWGPGQVGVLPSPQPLIHLAYLILLLLSCGQGAWHVSLRLELQAMLQPSSSYSSSGASLQLQQHKRFSTTRDLFSNASLHAILLLSLSQQKGCCL
jgi:hypothetical protein